MPDCVEDEVVLWEPIAARCENLVSGRAYKLGDVLTSMDGTTVEINNTDAGAA